MTDYERTLARLAEARMQNDALEAKRKQLMAAFLAEHADLYKALDVAANAEAEAAASVRTAAIDAYYHDGQKQRPGVTIRITKRIIYEPAQALTWAIEHKLCLGLDKRAFEALAKTQTLDIVVVTDEPQAAIDSDLSAWLVKS